MDKAALVAEQNLVSREGETIYTTSLIVADKFGKQHKNVLQSIDTLQRQRDEAGLDRLNFQPIEYIDSASRAKPMFRMDQEAFTHLAWGFIGVEAKIWQDKFYKAFEMMRDGMGNHLAVVEAHTRGMIELGENLKRLSMPVIQMQNDMVEVRTDVAGIKNELGTIKIEVARIKTATRRDFNPNTVGLFVVTVAKRYQNHCPCCQRVQILDSGGQRIEGLSHVDHWKERNSNKPVDGWLVCKPCNHLLEKERYKHVDAFNMFQKRLAEIMGPMQQTDLFVK